MRHTPKTVFYFSFLIGLLFPIHLFGETYTLSSAGTLANKISANEASVLTSLKINGRMDARDFDFIKWNCMSVEDVDLSGVSIDQYTGSYGTNEGYSYTYPANEIPLGAFFYWTNSYNHNNTTATSDEGMPSLKSIKLPV